MSYLIPYEVTNIILQYLSQLKNMKWIPFIDVKTGKVQWKINKYSFKYSNIKNILLYKNFNFIINIEVIIRRENQIINTFNCCGNIYNCIGKTIYITFNDKSNFTYYIYYTYVYIDNQLFGLLNYFATDKINSIIEIEIY